VSPPSSCFQTCIALLAWTLRKAAAGRSNFLSFLARLFSCCCFSPSPFGVSLHLFVFFRIQQGLALKERIISLLLLTYLPPIGASRKRGKESGMEVDGLYFSGPVFYRFSPLLLPRTFSPTTLFFFFFFRSSNEAIHPIPEWDRGEALGSLPRGIRATVYY
jgi:hypothetical protein